MSEESFVIDQGKLNCAFVPIGSLTYPAAPVPAKILLVPLASTTLIIFPPVSHTYKLPEESRVIPAGPAKSLVVPVGFVRLPLESILYRELSP